MDNKIGNFLCLLEIKRESIQVLNWNSPSVTQDSMAFKFDLGLLNAYRLQSDVF